MSYGGVADTCLQICLNSAVTWEVAETKATVLGIIAGWTWPREPALETARRAESAVWCV